MADLLSYGPIKMCKKYIDNISRGCYTKNVKKLH